MSHLKENAHWEDGIYQIETSDPVLGGPDGLTNRPARELANRTLWLKQQLTAAEEALDAHARSRNHPDASVTEKGLVKLESSHTSGSETEAATPKAVKSVNDRLNAVVDNAPADLDTLNKLAQAISNNPKFAENVTQRLNQKLAKNENGADIPDKNLFLKNQGFCNCGYWLTYRQHQAISGCWENKHGENRLYQGVKK
jgi:phage-related tail fiber protein